ncbi:hypothetical protein M885DRAFT_508051, partial [Pelagophyceae sp. CCMP2097]
MAIRNDALRRPLESDARRSLGRSLGGPSNDSLGVPLDSSLEGPSTVPRRPLCDGPVDGPWDGRLDGRSTAAPPATVPWAGFWTVLGRSL